MAHVSKKFWQDIGHVKPLIALRKYLAPIVHAVNPNRFEEQPPDQTDASARSPL